MGGADGKVGELGPHAAQDCIWNVAVPGGWIAIESCG
jgi:hypothetical protein